MYAVWKTDRAAGAARRGHADPGLRGQRVVFPAAVGVSGGEPAFVPVALHAAHAQSPARVLRGVCTGLDAAGAGIFRAHALRLELRGDHIGQRRADALVGVEGDAEFALRT